MSNNKGFTLIELLAVIIILGVILLIAIPSVTESINNSRKETYVTTAQNLVKGAITIVNSGDLSMYDTDATYYIPSSCINLESGGSSPFGEFDPAYVVVTYDNNTFRYYWTSRDTASQGIKNITPYDKLEKSLIKPNIKKNAVTSNTAIGERSKILLLSDSNCTEFTEQPIKRRVNEDGSSMGTPDELYNNYMDDNNSLLTGIDYQGNANVVEFLQGAIDSGYAGSPEEREEHDKKILENIGKYIMKEMTYSELNNFAGQTNYYSNYKQIFQYGYDSGGGKGRLWFKESWSGMSILMTKGGYTQVPSPVPSSGKFYTNYPMFFGESTFGVGNQYYVELKVGHSGDKITSASLRLGKNGSSARIYTVNA